MKKRAFYFFVACIVSALLFSPVFRAQNFKPLNFPHKNDTAALRAIVEKADVYSDEDPDSSLYLSRMVIDIISENKNPPAPIKTSLQRIKAYALLNLGYIYDSFGDIPKCVGYYEDALKIYVSLKEARGEAWALNNLAQIHESNGDYVIAFKYYERSLKLVRSVKDRRDEGDALNNLAHIYEIRNSFDTAMQYFNESLAIRKSYNDTGGVAMSLNNLGTLYFKMGNYKEAERLIRESIPLRELVSDVSGMSASLVNLSYILLKDNKLQEARKTASQALDLSNRLNQPAKIRSAAKVLYAVYKAMKDDEKALTNYKLYVKMNDSITADANKKASIKSQLKYEYDKKAAADSIRVSEERKVAEVQIQQEKTQRYTLSGGLILVVLFALFMVNRFRVTNKQKKIIEEQKKTVELQKGIVEVKQKEVLDSIHYAKRIQISLLPQEKYIDKILKSKSKK